MTSSEETLYAYALSCALTALVNRAGCFGRGWYFFVGGDLVVFSEVVL